MRLKRHIVAAAISDGDVIVSMKRPARHGDVIRKMAEIGFPIPIVGKQGFLTSDGLFVCRKEARKIADAAGQIIASRVGSDRVPHKFQHPELFSEDVW